MSWNSVSEYQLPHNLPPSGAALAPPSFLWKFNGQVCVAVQRENYNYAQVDLDGRLGGHLRGVSFQRTLIQQIGLEFQMDEEILRGIADSHLSGDLREFLWQASSALSLKQKFGIRGQHTLGVGGDRDWCFFFYQNVMIDYPVSAPVNISIPGHGTAPTRLRLKGTVTIKFGLTRAAWSQVLSGAGRGAVRAGRRVLPFVRALAQATGRGVAAFLETTAGMITAVNAVSAAGGVAGTGILTWATSALLADARYQGEREGIALQFAYGYVRSARICWIHRHRQHLWNSSLASLRAPISGQRASFYAARIDGIKTAVEDSRRFEDHNQNLWVTLRQTYTREDHTNIEWIIARVKDRILAGGLPARISFPRELRLPARESHLPTMGGGRTSRMIRSPGMIRLPVVPEQDRGCSGREIESRGTPDEAPLTPSQVSNEELGPEFAESVWE